MNPYPSTTGYEQLAGSVAEIRDDIRTDFATNGALQQRAFYTVQKHDFTVKHILSKSNMALLRTFYTNNRILTVTLLWSGNNTTYTVRFRGPLKETWTNGWWAAEASLAEV